jgi:hypothetical protein
MHLGKLLNTETGKYIMSALLGFGLATIFRMTCEGKNCIIYSAPDFSEIKDKTFQHNDACYVYTHVPQTCNDKEPTVPFV